MPWYRSAGPASGLVLAQVAVVGQVTVGQVAACCGGGSACGGCDGTSSCRANGAMLAQLLLTSLPQTGPWDPGFHSRPCQPLFKAIILHVKSLPHLKNLPCSVLEEIVVSIQELFGKGF